MGLLPSILLLVTSLLLEAYAAIGPKAELHVTNQVISPDGFVREYEFPSRVPLFDADL